MNKTVVLKKALSADCLRVLAAGIVSNGISFGVRGEKTNASSKVVPANTNLLSTCRKSDIFNVFCLINQKRCLSQSKGVGLQLLVFRMLGFAMCSSRQIKAAQESCAPTFSLSPGRVLIKFDDKHTSWG